jgi:hypothetical protein
MRIRTIGLALVAAFALSAIASATASAALPEIVNKEGKTLVKNKYTSKSGKATLETGKNGAVICSASTDKGETTGVKTGVSTVTFTGCESTGIKCSSSGAKSGEIVSKATSQVVYELNSKKEKEAALLLVAEEATIKCSAFQTLKVKGSVLGLLSPINKLSKELTLTFLQTKGAQASTEYGNEGEEMKKAVTETKGEGLKTFAFEPSGLETVDTLTFEEEVEVKA